MKTLATLTLLAAMTTLSACGGLDDDGGKDTAFHPTTGATTASAQSIASGRALYTQYCASCHGASRLSAKNSSQTLNAIASNRGGMGALSAVIQATQADDIAAYLAFGL